MVMLCFVTKQIPTVAPYVLMNIAFLCIVEVSPMCRQTKDHFVDVNPRYIQLHPHIFPNYFSTFSREVPIYNLLNEKQNYHVFSLIGMTQRGLQIPSAFNSLPETDSPKS